MSIRANSAKPRSTRAARGARNGAAAKNGQVPLDVPNVQTGTSQERLAERKQGLAIPPAGYFSRAMWWQWPLAVMMLIGFLPVMILLGILIRVTSPGPAIYRQKRLGRNGKPFTLYKFRSMRTDAEKGTGPVWAAPGDPRVTLLGKVSRNLHLDELPQLVNVIRGEMSLVGPRPERPEFAARIEQSIPEFSHRLCVRPGITGLAQIHQGPDTDLESVRRKLTFDLEYVKRGALWLDLRIMVCTLLRASELTRSWGVRLLKIPLPDSTSSLEQQPMRGMELQDMESAQDGGRKPLTPMLLPIEHAAENEQRNSNGRPSESNDRHAAPDEAQPLVSDSPPDAACSQ